MKNMVLLLTVIALSAILLSGYKTGMLSGTGLSASIAEFDQIPQPEANISSNEVPLVVEHLSHDNHIITPYSHGVDPKSKDANSPAMNPEKLPYQLNWKTLLYFLFTRDRLDSEKTHNN